MLCDQSDFFMFFTSFLAHAEENAVHAKKHVFSLYF